MADTLPWRGFETLSISMPIYSTAAVAMESYDKYFNNITWEYDMLLEYVNISLVVDKEDPWKERVERIKS